MDKASLIFATAATSAGSVGTFVLAQMEAITPGSAIAAIATQGVLGAVAAFSLFRLREKDIEHAREREVERAARAAENKALLDAMGQAHRELAKIGTMLEQTLRR